MYLSSTCLFTSEDKFKATFTTIKKTLVILLGTGWTDRAKRLISTSCIDVLSIEPLLLDEVLSEYGVKFIWDEKNDVVPKLSWEKFHELPEEKLEEIKEKIIKLSGIEETIRAWFKRYILEQDPEEKLKLDYICEERVETLNRFISEKE
ncbi:MAG: hypothetical protein QXK90_01475 [Candidatus Parvarchaeota archaeon]